MASIIVLGGGITGLAIAADLAKDNKVTLIEKEEECGGMCKSKLIEGYNLDFGPHKLYSQIPGVMEEFKKISDVVTTKKVNSIMLKNKLFSFPVSIPQIGLRMNPLITMKLGLGFLKSKFVKIKNVKTYEDYLINGFGKYGYEMIFKDYAPKLWAEGNTLSAELAKKRVPAPDIMGMVKGIFSKKEKSKISADEFLYPVSGGVNQICKDLEKQIIRRGGKVLKGKSIKRFVISKKMIKGVMFDDLSKLDADHFISTILLKDLTEYLWAPDIIKNRAKELKYRSLAVFFLFFDKDKLMKDNWIFFPEKDYVFNRVAELKSFNPSSFPSGKTVLSAEVTFDDKIDLKETKKQIIKDLIKAKICDGKDVQKVENWVMHDVYPVYDLNYKENLNIVLRHLDQITNLISVGRQGLYNYNNMDHCLDMASKAANNVRNGGDWTGVRKQFDEYKIVD